MKKLVLAVMAVVLTACTTVSQDRLIATKVLPASLALVKPNGSAYCSATAITKLQAVTATHCLIDEIPLVVRAEGGQPLAAKVVFRGDTLGKDIALIELMVGEFSSFVPVADSGELGRGDSVYITGNPYGELTYSFAKGMVGFVGRMLPEEDFSGEPLGTTFGPFVQLYIESRGGNSGGGMFNTAGELVGVVVRSDGKGLTFAVPIRTICLL